MDVANLGAPQVVDMVWSHILNSSLDPWKVFETWSSETKPGISDLEVLCLVTVTYVVVSRVPLSLQKG